MSIGVQADLTDEQLLERYKTANDTEAFNTLYERHAGGLAKYLRNILRNEAATEDAVQQTFLHLHQRHDKFEPSHRFRPWLYSLAANIAIDAHRVIRGRSAVERPLTVSLQAIGQEAWHNRRDFEPIDAKAQTPAELSELGEQKAKVMEAIGRLSDTDRRLINLIYVEQLSAKDAAEQVGITHAAARIRLCRALATIRHEIGDSDTLSAVA